MFRNGAKAHRIANLTGAIGCGLLAMIADAGVTEFTSTELRSAEILQASALASSEAYGIVESLTSDVGPRSAGSPGDRAALTWALAMLRKLGCIAAAADKDLCYAMLCRRKGEAVIELLHRLDKAIAEAAESATTIDEVNPPGGFPSIRP